MSSTNGVGGLVFSAAADTFSLLVRALKVQGRIDVLSRPQIMTMDSQTAKVNIGQDVPILSSTTLTATGLSNSSIEMFKVTCRLRG